MGRSARDRLGLAVQLCTLPWLGFVPDDVTAAPPAAVTRLAEQLHVDAGALAGYGEREQTRTDHLRLVLQYAGWRVPRSLEVKELDEFLLARAMEHDSPSLLFRLACEHLRASQVVRPGVATLSERVAAARAKAERETYDRLAHLLTDTRCSELDGLLVTDAASTGTYLLPAVAIVLGVLVLGETITGTILAGIALVLAGVALTRRRRSVSDGH